MFGKTETTRTTVQSDNTLTIVDAIKAANGAVKNNATTETIDFKPVVESFDITISSPADVDAVEKTVYLFNEDFLNASPARNSVGGAAGAAALTITYGDGRSGKVYNKMLSNSYGAKGVKIDEILISANSIANTVGDESFFSKVKMFLIGPDGEGNDIPKPIKWSLAKSNQPNKDGIYRMKVNFRLNYLSQIKLNVSPDVEANLSFIPAENQN